MLIRRFPSSMPLSKLAPVTLTWLASWKRCSKSRAAMLTITMPIPAHTA